MKIILVSLAGLFLAGTLYAQDENIASKYNLFTGQIDTVTYTADTMAVYLDLAYGTGDYEGTDTTFADGKDSRNAAYSGVKLGFNWAPKDDVYLSVGYFIDYLRQESAKQALANGTQSKELNKNTVGSETIQLQLATKEGRIGGGLQFRINTETLATGDSTTTNATGESESSEVDADVFYTDFELYLTTQLVPEFSAGVGYAPAVNAVALRNENPAQSTDSYYLAGHGAQTKLHAVISPADIVSIRFDYISEKVNRFSNDPAKTTTKIGAYLLAGLGILSADYTTEKGDQYILSTDDAKEGKESQPEYSKTLVGVRYQMVATADIHLDFRYDVVNEEQEKLTTASTGGYTQDLGIASFRILYTF